LSSDSNEHPIIGPDHQLPAVVPSQSRHQVIRIVVWVVILSIFALGFLYIWRHHDTTPKRPSRRGGAGGVAAITTVTAQKGDLGVYLNAIGTVTPVHTVSITSQVNGVITAVHYKEGQIVHRGDPLIDIDSRTYRATLLQAQGILERDENILAQAKMDLARYQDAWRRNAIPKQTLDDQEKIVLQDEGTVKNDQGTVQFDQVQVDYCHITAPFTGRVGLRLVDPGNVVQSSGGTTLAVITEMQPITVIFTIAEDNLGQVQPRIRNGAKLPVYAFDRTALTQIASGSLLTLDNQIDTTTGTVKARAMFANNDSRLYPNEFVNTRLLVNTLHGVTLLPASAVQHNGQDSFVYVIKNNVAHVRSVKPGASDENTVQVEGVKPGEVVADSSFEKLQDGSPISIAQSPVAASTTGSEAP
jgi:multidrug efflux system membrane fusion protein